ncbi:MAG: hypothetical protein MZW92_06165 [Comamonadaceae bacterium]|nr:hypothetical protein [Comamonadaceae bacterium]
MAASPGAAPRRCWPAFSAAALQRAGAARATVAGGDAAQAAAAHALRHRRSSTARRVLQVAADGATPTCCTRWPASGRMPAPALARRAADRAGRPHAQGKATTCRPRLRAVRPAARPADARSIALRVELGRALFDPELARGVDLLRVGPRGLRPARPGSPTPTPIACRCWCCAAGGYGAWVRGVARPGGRLRPRVLARGASGGAPPLLRRSAFRPTATTPAARSLAYFGDLAAGAEVTAIRRAQRPSGSGAMSARLLLIGGGHAHLRRCSTCWPSAAAAASTSPWSPAHGSQVYSGMLPGHLAGHYSLRAVLDPARPGGGDGAGRLRARPRRAARPRAAHRASPTPAACCRSTSSRSTPARRRTARDPRPASTRCRCGRSTS